MLRWLIRYLLQLSQNFSDWSDNDIVLSTLASTWIYCLMGPDFGTRVLMGPGFGTRALMGPDFGFKSLDGSRLGQILD